MSLLSLGTCGFQPRLLKPQLIAPGHAVTNRFRSRVSLSPAFAMLVHVNRGRQSSAHAQDRVFHCGELSRHQFIPLLLKNHRRFVDVQAVVDLAFPRDHRAIVSANLLEQRHTGMRAKSRFYGKARESGIPAIEVSTTMARVNAGISSSFLSF